MITTIPAVAASFQIKLTEMILESVSYLQVPVKNLEESTEWYMGNLGFEVHWKRPDNKMTILALQTEG